MPYPSETSAFDLYRTLDIFHLALAIDAVYVYIVANWGNTVVVEYIHWYEMVSLAHLTFHNKDMDRDRSLKVRNRRLRNSSVFSSCGRVSFPSSKLLSMYVVNFGSY